MLTIADINIEHLVWTVFEIIGLALICWLPTWFVDYVDAGTPFNKVAKVVIVGFAVLVLILIIPGFAGKSPVHFS